MKYFRSGRVRYIRLDFQLFDADTREMIVFSDLPEIISRSFDPDTESILNELCLISEKGLVADALRTNSLMFRFLDTVHRSKKKEHDASSSMVVTRVLEYLHDRYTSNITSEELSLALNISQTHMRREFKRHTGQAITEYINQRRIHKSIILLSQTDRSVLDIAFELEGNNAEYYARVFKKIMGVPPSVYRKCNIIL